MAAAETTTTTQPTTSPSRKTLRTAGRNKRKEKLKTDPAFKKAYFEGKSKRATDKKAGFRKKKRNKK